MSESPTRVYKTPIRSHLVIRLCSISGTHSDATFEILNEVICRIGFITTAWIDPISFEDYPVTQVNVLVQESLNPWNMTAALHSEVGQVRRQDGSRCAPGRYTRSKSSG